MNGIRNRPLDIALLTTLVSIGLHAYLTQQHYGLKFGGTAGPSMCNVNAVFNCDAVAASSYSVFLGLPLALWAMMTNLVLLCFLVITRLNWTEDREGTGRVTLLLATFVAAMSLVMGGISLAFMHAYCLFCMVAYVLSFIGWGAVYTGVGGFAGRLLEDVQSVFGEKKWILGFLLAIPAFAFLFNSMAEEGYGAKRLKEMAPEIVSNWAAAPTQTFSDKGLIIASSNEPRMTIVEFADFRCPHCRHAYPTLDAFAHSRSDVKLIYKFYPLDGTCNGGMSGGGDGLSCLLAYMVQCEEKNGGNGWKAHHHIFDNQEKYSSISAPAEMLKQYCEATGTDCTKLKECTESPDTKDEVKAMAQEGIDAKIAGTPAVFVNGKLLSLGQTLPVLEAVYSRLPAK